MAPLRALVVGLLVAMLGACGGTPTKEEEEAAKNTYVCHQDGERLLIRFDVGEARLLTAAGERIILYQIPAASGVRYSNGTLELRGKGTDLQLIRDGVAQKLADCQPYAIPQK